MGVRVGVLNKRRIAGELIGDVEIAAQPLVATRIEAAEVPRLVDELPLVALLGAFAHGTTEVTGAEELRAKESDRIETVTAALRAIGVRIEARPDGFAVRGVPSRPAAARSTQPATTGSRCSARSPGPSRARACGSKAPNAWQVSFPGFFSTRLASSLSRARRARGNAMNTNRDSLTWPFPPVEGRKRP